MRYYEASPMIASSPEALRAVLTDGAAWPSWDSGADGADGQIAPGEKITIRSQAAPGRAFPVDSFSPDLSRLSIGSAPKVVSPSVAQQAARDGIPVRLGPRAASQSLASSAVSNCP